MTALTLAASAPLCDHEINADMLTGLRLPERVNTFTEAIMSTLELNQPPLKIVTLVYPGATFLDYIGPCTALSLFGDIQLIWKNREPVFGDFIQMLPNATFADLPEHFDVLLIPGGGGVLAPLIDDEVLAFVQECGRRADYITAVCSGSLILGMAGLLEGYRATSHWATHDLLADFGAIPVKARIVEDRNRLTGGGITAGLDFGLTLLAKLRGPEAAKMAQLLMEYNPAPPFEAGSPETAGPGLTELIAAQAGPANDEIRRLIAERKKRFGAST